MTFSSVIWGIAIGILPYFHQPMLIVFAVLLPWYFLIYPKLRVVLLTIGLTAGILIIPQLTSVFLSFTRHPGLDPGSSSFFLWIPAFAGMTKQLWYPGYLVHEGITFQQFLSFWFQNLGLHALLIPLASS